MPHNPAEHVAIAEACTIATDYAQTGRRPPLSYRRALAALANVTSRPDLLLAAAVTLAKRRDWYTGEAVALFVGAGVSPEVVYRQAWAGLDGLAAASCVADRPGPGRCHSRRGHLVNGPHFTW